MMKISELLNYYSLKGFLGSNIFILYNSNRIIMKNILAENMRRFKTKNLNEDLDLIKEGSYREMIGRIDPDKGLDIYNEYFDRIEIPRESDNPNIISSHRQLKVALDNDERLTREVTDKDGKQKVIFNRLGSMMMTALGWVITFNWEMER